MSLADPPARRTAAPVPPVAPVGYTQGQVAASLAANPNASKGGYEGVGATYGPTAAATMPDAAPPYDPYGGTDPILAKIQAANVNARSAARTDAAASAKALAIQFGDGSGFGVDATTQAEAAGNPYSTLATLLKGYRDTAHQHDEELNQQNLFYSGARVKQLGEDAYNYGHGTYDARQNALAQFGQINSGLASALSSADNSDMNAAGDAYGRAQNRALTYGYDPGQITDNANTNVGKTPAAAPAASGASTYGAPQSTTFGGSAGPYISGYPPLASALNTPTKKPAAKLANPYLTNPNKRG